MSKIEITYGDETVTLTADLAQASAPLIVDGEEIGRQVADARHRTDLAVAIAARAVWPEADWPSVPSVGSIPEDWSEGSEAWDELAYETVAETAGSAARVMDYDTGETLDGEPSAELIEASAAEASGTGAVAAYLAHGVWQYVPESQEDFYRRQCREDVRTVWVQS